VQPDAFYPTAAKTRPNWTSYGLGWFQQDYRGRKIDFHTGSIDGLVAIVGLAREERFGVAIYANLDHAELRHALMFSAFDLFLDGALARDWNGDLRALYAERQASSDARRREREAKRVAERPPSLPLDRFAGRYEHPLRGSLELVATADGAALTLTGGYLAATLTPWHFDTFRVEWTPKFYGISWATFRLGVEGNVEAVELDGVLYPRAEASAAPGR
jgi:hypothetical protein